MKLRRLSFYLGFRKEFGLIIALMIAVLFFISPSITNAQQNQEVRINWLEICQNPLVDAIISEPCNTLTTPDGFTLTPEGEKVLGCLGGGALAVLAGIPELTSLGEAVGCGGDTQERLSKDSFNTDSTIEDKPVTTSGYVQWNYLVKEDGLSYVQLPSNWDEMSNIIPDMTSAFEHTFGYIDENGDTAAVLLYANKSDRYNNSGEMAEALLEDAKDRGYDILQPINCSIYKLDKMPACSFLISLEFEEGVKVNWLNVVHVSSDGIEVGAVFFAKPKLFEKLFPTGQRIIESVDIDSDKINKTYNYRENENSDSLSAFGNYSNPDLEKGPAAKTKNPQNNSNSTTNQTPGFEITEF